MTIMAEQLISCIGCGALVPEQTGPTHRYLESAPGCWAIYGEVLAREYSDPAFMAIHRLTVDTYAVQHPGTPSPQSIQSVGIHLLRLYLILERGFNDAAAANIMTALTRQKGLFHWLTPPRSLGDKTVLHVWNARGAAEHTQAVREWARSAWTAWGPHHEQVKRWLPEGLS
jgi:hypothetical protein